ncbi:MAG: hypothetical protein WCG36_01585 [bacterium]
MSNRNPDITFKSHCRDGQAVVELIVALVVILVLLAGIIQVGWLGVHQSRAMMEARRKAGVKAMMPVSSFAAPRFIRSCTVGADGIAYSRDDDLVPDDPAVVTDGIVAYAHPSQLDGIMPDNPVSALSKSVLPATLFGLVQGEQKDRIALVPVIRDLVYQADEIEVRGSAWMTWMEGVY